MRKFFSWILCLIIMLNMTSALAEEAYSPLADEYNSDTISISEKTELQILSWLKNVTVADGEQARVSFEAQGDGLTYEWYYAPRGSSTFTKANTFTSNFYEVPMNSARNGRQIYCVVTDKYGNSIQTNTVTLGITPPPYPPIYLEDVTVAKGETARVSFEIHGDNLTYTWYWAPEDSTNFIKTFTFTSNFYEVEMNEYRDGRQIYCVITDTYGNSIQTNVATLHMLSVPTPLIITKQPESIAVADGTDAYVSFDVQGDELTYEWYYASAGSTDFIKTSTFNSNFYRASMNKYRDGRQIYCVITDKYGNSVQTDTVTINMITPVKIIKQPESVAVPEGEQARICFEAQGDGLTYEWYYAPQGSSIFAKTNTFTSNFYEVEMNKYRDGRQIYCIVKDKYGSSVQTNTVTISRYTTPNPNPFGAPFIQDAFVQKGEIARVCFGAYNDQFTYEWYYAPKGESVFYKTYAFTANFYEVEMNEYRDGRQLYCVITDKYGNSAQTDTVTINMITPVKIIKQPESVTVLEGEQARICFEAQGDGLTYEWYYAPAGSSSFAKTYSFVSNFYEVQMTEARYGRQLYCIVTDKYGNSVQTNTVTIGKPVTLRILKQPESVSVSDGEEAYVSFEVSGNELTYEWYYAPAGSTDFIKTSTFNSNFYRVSMNKYRDGRQIYCVVTDKYGNSVQTDTVTLHMFTPLVITKQLRSITVENGKMANISFEVQGDGLTYQWYWSNKNESNFIRTYTFNSNFYSAEMNTIRDGRQIYCVVTDKYGNSVQTDTVTIHMLSIGG